MNLLQTRMNDLVVNELETELSIFHLKTDRAYCLNQTSAEIWNLCNGTKTLTEISKSLTKNLKQPFSKDLIWLALDGLKKDNLLENNEPLKSISTACLGGR